MTTMKCCHIADEGQRLLKQPGLLSGDERMIIDRHGCKTIPEWEIFGGGNYENITHACSAHVGVLLTEGANNQVYPLPDYKS
ncbi:MAG TPA: hypothetical protein VLN57_20990 [Xanthobacteraceae bacterium]|nr:hypothetical protein [Xanthobacteraceae bacterium]